METTIQETKTYSVPGVNMSMLRERIEKLNKRCVKLGIPAITMTEEFDYQALEFTCNGNRVWVRKKDAKFTQVTGWVYKKGYEATGRIMNWRKVTVTGTAPKYTGWRFVATLEPIHADGQTVNLIMTVPGQTCPNQYIDYAGRCDHCQAKRNRKQTFVVCHENGTYKAVGRQCLKDFLGHEDPNRLASWAELLAGLGGLCEAACDEGWGGWGEGNMEWDLQYALGWVAAVARVHGWLSRTRARELDKQSTADHVLFIFNPPRKMSETERKEWEAFKAECTPTAKDLAEAEAALVWAEALDLDALMNGTNNYLTNVAILARANRVDCRTMGLGASIIAAAAKGREKASQAAQRPESVPVGTVGKRDQYRVKVERVIPREGNYGTTYITKMLAWDEARNCYANEMVWFASTCHDFNEGGEYLVRATIKKHDEYQGRAQTVVARVA